MTGLPEEAATVAGLLLEHCRDALADAGDADVVSELLTAADRPGPIPGVG